MSAEGVGAVLEAVAAYVEAVQRDREADEAVEQAYFRGSRRAASIARAQFGDTESPLIETTDRLLALDPAHLRALAAGQAEAGAKEVERAQKSLERTEQWYAERWERLTDLLRGTPYWSDVACIMANGTRDVFEPPTYAQQMSALRWERDRWKKQALAALAPADAPAAQDGAGGRA